MLAVLGGGAKVTARLRTLGVDGIDIGEAEINVAARLSCPPSVAMPTGGWTFAAVDACPDANEADHVAAARRELAGSPNIATSDALVELLGRLDRGGLLSDASRRLLLATLVGTITGPQRIKGLLPPGTPAAHKTGTGAYLPGVCVDQRRGDRDAAERPAVRDRRDGDGIVGADGGAGADDSETDAGGVGFAGTVTCRPRRGGHRRPSAQTATKPAAALDLA